MKLAAMSDLHYPESKVDLAALAATVKAANADVLLLVGDAVSQFHPPLLREVFSTLRGAAPLCAYVPGNHELWSKDGSTAAIYEHLLPELCTSQGWHYLDAAPLYVGDVAVVGNLGWYDYSLTERARWPDVRVALGAEMMRAARGVACETVPLSELTDAHLADKAMVVMPDAMMKDLGLKPALLRWNDRRFVRLGVSDQAFTQDCARRLKAHLEEAATRADRIVVATHTAPFGATLPTPAHPVEAISRAYMGASLLGQVILEAKRVTLAVHGHRHRPGEHLVEHLPVLNVTARPDRGGNVVIRDV